MSSAPAFGNSLTHLVASATLVVLLAAGCIVLPFSSQSSPPLPFSEALPTPTIPPTPMPSPTPTPTATPTPTPTPVRIISEEKYLQLRAGDIGRVPLNAQSGDYVSGSFTVRGGTVLGVGRDIIFYISDPLGNYVKSPSVIADYHAFSFTATSSGEYRLVFDNTRASFTGRQIDVRVTRPLR